MKHSTNNLANAVENSLSNDKGKKIGRPCKTEYEKLLSQIIKKFIDYEDAIELFVNKKSVKNKSFEEAEAIRQEKSEERYIGKNLFALEQQIDVLQETQCCQDLIDNKKRLSSLLSKKENMIDDEVFQPVGRPTRPLGLTLARTEFEFTDGFENFNKLEIDNCLKVTSKADIKKLADERRKIKSGRNKKSTLDNLYSSVKKSENKIKQLNENIENFSIDNKLGRKRHGKKQLKEEYLALKKLKNQIYEIENKMTKDELFIHKIRQLNSTKNSLQRRQKYAKNYSIKNDLKKELLAVSNQIDEKKEAFENFKNEYHTKVSSKKNDITSIEIHKQGNSAEEYKYIKSRLINLLVENIELKSKELKLLLSSESMLKSA